MKIVVVWKGRGRGRGRGEQSEQGEKIESDLEGSRKRVSDDGCDSIRWKLTL